MSGALPEVIVVACGAAKASERRPAMDLYTGSLFRAARRAALADGRAWLICSAEHGLLTPGQLVDPYDRALADTPADIARLAGVLAGQRHLLAAAAGRPDPGVEAWTPARYTAALAAGGIDVRRTPLAGRGLGAQIGWLTNHASTHSTRLATPPTPGAVPAPATTPAPARRGITR